MKAKVKVRSYLVCPNCGEETTSRIDHLFGTSTKKFGPWDCNHCNKAFEGTIHSPDNIEIQVTEVRKVIPTTVLLVLPPQDKPVYITVEGMYFPAHGKAIGENDAYFYDQHSCPTNWLRPDRIYIDGDADPHGLFRHVRTMLKSEADEIDETIHLNRGHQPGSSDSSTDQEVIETLFPEITRDFIPDGE